VSDWLEIDGAVFRASFDREPFRIRHRLAEHPLFQLPRIVELAQRLPAQDVEYNAGDLDVNQDPALTPQTGLSAEETIRRIEKCGSWMALKYVEHDPEYRRVLDECLDAIALHSEPISPGMARREGFIFIGSPGAVTPYHMDPEFNFLLHIRGPKTMRVFPRDDRSVLSEQEIEYFYTASRQRNMVYREEYGEKARVFELVPGDGLHVPVNTPHWVKVGEHYAISFSITFRTSASDRRSAVHAANAWLRRHGVDPLPFGASRRRDSLKHLALRGVRRTRRLLGVG
jgi:hypothetical protein